ncbi:MAG: hypothetical protein ACKVPX_18155 [Myxococcaceae bacterium]
MNVPDWILQGVSDVIAKFTPSSGERRFTVSQDTVVAACMVHAPEGTTRADAFKNKWFDIERDPRLKERGWIVEFSKGYAFTDTESEFHCREASRPRGAKAP